jgi:hypothetical protein
VQDGAAVHAASYSINDLNKVFEDRLTSFKLWPAVLNPCEFYVWGSIKNKAYSNNPHTLEELKHNIGEAITSVEVRT